MEEKRLDIKDFQPYSSVSDNDKVLMAKGGTGTDASITIALLRTILTNEIKPEIKDGVWYIGGVSTGVSAGAVQLRLGENGIEYRYSDNDEWAMLITVSKLQEPAVNIAEELRTHPCKVSENYTWMIWNAVNKVYTDTGISARGRSPIIRDMIWWVWDEEKGDYVSTGQAVNDTFVLTKEAVEGVFVGNIVGHHHLEYTVPTIDIVPTDTTLTWTDSDNNLYMFYVGQLCRVADLSSDNGYKFYQLYDIKDGAAVWGEISGGGGVGKTYESRYPNGEIFNDYVSNIALGQYAHAEGRETNATGPRAHAEGYQTKVFAADAHAEGRETWCLGAQGHVEGFYSISYGANSHVEGCAYGGYPYAPLTKTILAIKDEEFIRTLYANTDYFLTYLDKTLFINDKFYEDFIFHGSFGERNHVEGVNNSVLCNTSHVEGFNNTVGNSITRHGANSVHHAAHVEGSYNEFVESGAQSSIHIEGSYNSIIETSSTIINEDGSIYITYYDATGSHVEGCHNVISAYDKSNDSRQKAIASHVGGSNCTITKASYAFAHGYGLSIANDYEASFGKYNLSYINGKKIIFSVGIGSSDEKRENAISIFEDGSVSIPKLEGGSISEQIDNAFNPLSNKLNNYYNELNKRLENLENAIKDITSVISMLHPELKVYVVGDKIIMTNLIDAIVSNDLLEINDSETNVIDDTLVFGEYIPQTEKAFVKSSTLYFTSEAEVSVLDDTLITKDNDIYINNNILTII